MYPRISGAALLLPVALAGLLLSGCTIIDTPAEDESGDAATVKFVACLNSTGQTAKILSGGQVGLLLPQEPGDDGTVTAPPPGDGDGPVSAVAVFMDEDGAWMAAGDASAYPEEGGMRAAWEDCLVEVPDFEQPEPDFSDGDVQMVTQEQVIEIGLEFASCAREEGYTDFADPDENGTLDFPFGMPEDEFRSLMEACMSEDGIMPSISPESIESFDFDWMAIMQEFGGGGMISTVPAEPEN